MSNNEPRPGTWIGLTTGPAYRRLVAIARLRLVGREHLAEDAVSRAMVRWAQLPAAQHASARLETVVRSEAASLLRSEDRLHRREHRAGYDRALAAAPVDPTVELQLLRLALAQQAEGTGCQLSSLDREAFELLLAGCSLADVVQLTGVMRHQVRRSRDRLRGPPGRPSRR